MLAAVLAVILALPAPAAAGLSAGAVPIAQAPGLDALLQFLRQLQQQIYQVSAWLWSLTDPTDALREQLAPILDRVYAAQDLAQRIQALAASLPASLQWVFGALAARLRALPAPRAGTPRWTIERVIQTQPAGPVAEQARALDRVLEHNATALAGARTAAETARTAAQEVADDPRPGADAEAAVAAAQELAARAQTTPSTRAAVQLLVEAFAAQMDQHARMALHVVARQTAVIQQQALLGQQLATVVDRLATAIDLQNAQQKEALRQQVHGLYNQLEGQRQTYGELTGALLELNSDERRRAREALFRALREGP
jgi:hypothetical protein